MPFACPPEAALKTILNGLAMQYQGDFQSAEDKQANLQRVLADIEQENQRERPSRSSSAAYAHRHMSLKAG